MALPVHGWRQQQAAGGLVQEAREGDNSGHLLQQMRSVLAEGLACILCMPHEILTALTNLFIFISYPILSTQPCHSYSPSNFIQLRYLHGCFAPQEC